MNLTQDLRRELTNKAVDAVFKKKIEDADLAIRSAGQSYYNEQYAPYVMAMGALPDDAFPYADCFGTRRDAQGGNHERVVIRTMRDVPLFHARSWTDSGPRTEAAGALLEQYVTAEKKKSRLRDDREKLFNRTFAALANIRTFAQLTKQWPKFAKFLPAEQTTNLPAVRFEDLNAALEL